MTNYILTLFIYQYINILWKDIGDTYWTNRYMIKCIKNLVFLVCFFNMQTGKHTMQTRYFRNCNPWWLSLCFSEEYRGFRWETYKKSYILTIFIHLLSVIIHLLISIFTYLFRLYIYIIYFFENIQCVAYLKVDKANKIFFVFGNKGKIVILFLRLFVMV